MTREDKQYVINICRILADKMDDSGKVAVEQVISAVRDLEEQMPEQDPCGDAISRQAVLDAMSDTWKHICSVARRRKPTKGEEAVYSDMVGTVKSMPSVTPKPKTGRWIYDRRRDWDGECAYECSECGMGSDDDHDYCPNCGAKMESEEQA